MLQTRYLAFFAAGDHEAVLARRRVREVPKRGEHRYHPRGSELGHVADADERPIGDPCHAVEMTFLGLGAVVYLVPALEGTWVGRTVPVIHPTCVHITRCHVFDREYDYSPDKVASAAPMSE
jgi:hypothetical protein